MQEHDVLVFLLSLAVLLSAARFLGEFARRLGRPAKIVFLAATSISEVLTIASDPQSTAEARTARHASLADI